MLTIQVPKIKTSVLIALSLEKRRVRAFLTTPNNCLKQSFPSRFWILFNILLDFIQYTK
jgi:hypothetical protein